MDRIILIILGLFWLLSVVYVIYYLNKQYVINLKTILQAIIAGPFIAFVMKEPLKEEEYPNDYIRQFLISNDEDKLASWFDVRKNLKKY